MSGVGEVRTDHADVQGARRLDGDPGVEGEPIDDRGIGETGRRVAA
jgi:hypothetical protein